MNLHRLADSEPTEVLPGVKLQLVHGENLTTGYWELEVSAKLDGHSHPHEQIQSLIEGEMEFTVEGETTLLKAGDVLVIPPNAHHSAKVLRKCRIVDVWHPAREDYKQIMASLHEQK